MDAYGRLIEGNPASLWTAWLEDERGQRRVRLAQAVSREELETELKLAGQHPHFDRVVGIHESRQRRGTWGQPHGEARAS
jgi:hypothetical protein